MFSSKLRKVFKEKGYTIRSLAEASGVSSRTISTYSKPVVPVLDGRVVTALVRELQVELYDLFELQYDLGELMAA